MEHRMFVCFALGMQLLKELVISEKLNRENKYDSEKGIICAHIKQNILQLRKEKKNEELLFDSKAYWG